MNYAHYFSRELKNIMALRMIRILFVSLALVMILDPVSVYMNEIRAPGFFLRIGDSPFQFWLLLNSISWGTKLYQSLLLVFPVVMTGLLFFHERRSSVYEFCITRGSRKQFFLAKVSSLFLFTFVFFLLLLLLNILVTYLIFPGNTGVTEAYQYSVPRSGTFAASLYQIKPILVPLFYSMINALFIAIATVLVCGIHMIGKFRNAYIAMAVPFVLLFLSSLVTQVIEPLYLYSVTIILQPQASVALTSIVTGKHFLICLLVWAFLTMTVVPIGVKRNVDVL